ncbi:HK97 family phage prohead protease [[Clostridium] ultunense Esp]|nr:HK97 family phage prohead protease [[Clostridium] ultunense Esp]
MKEIRIAEIRAAEGNDLILEGYPIVFEQPTTIQEAFGEYTEVIKRGALDSADLSDTRLIYNHDLSKIPLARTPKTMKLTIEPAGLKMVAHLPDTEEARAIHTAVRRGDLSGMSFAFKVPEGGSTFDPITNTRTITRIEKVYEVSITPFPAIPKHPWRREPPF